MANKWLISTAYAVSCVALLGLTGCGGSAPEDGYGGPGPSAYEDSQGSGELLGGKTPPAAHDDGLAGGPVSSHGMASIPNPENLPLEERRRIYGNKYDHLKYRPLPGAGDYAQAAPGKGQKAPAGPLRSYRNERGVLVVHNAPIANPEDMSPAERRRIYGKRYAPSPQSGPRRHWLWQPKPKPKAAPKAAAAPSYKPAPAPKPAPKVAAAPVRPAPAPKVVAKPAPAPAKVAPPVVAKAAPAPAPAPAVKPAAVPPVAKAAAAPAVDPKMAALSTAVSAEAIKGATLTVPAELAKGQESRVTLSLPVSLLDVIQKEAGKLGLTKAAKKADVSATLSGEGYTITPNAAQTQRLKKGEAATFNWQVKPGDGEKTPLKAKVDGALVGQKGPARTFSIATLEEVVAKAVDTTQSQAKKLGFNLDKLAIPGLKPIKVGDTVIPPGATTAGIIALVIALILLAMARANSGRRARDERRRKFRTMTDYGRTEPEPVADRDHGHVNPMLAAAGVGAAAGAAAMTFGHHDDGHGDAHHGHEHHSDTAPMTFQSEEHGDHGHGHDDHAHGGHDAHGHDAHGHDAHGHDADGHGHDAHGHEAHGHDSHGNDDHGHAAHDAHGHDHHHREPEHA